MASKPNEMSAPSISNLPASQTDVLYPSDSGVINVKNFGAKGDGVTDDTKAIQAAIASISDFVEYGNIVYVPAGTYLVSGQLAWRDSSGNLTCYIQLQGQNKTNTTIQLKNNAAGFQNPNSPLAVLYTGNCIEGAGQVGTFGNTAFTNDINDLTVNTGSGNPGAIGIDVLANNDDQMNNVNVVSNDLQGVVGLNLSRGIEGPLFASNISVQGFNTGIQAGGGYAVWLEHIAVKNQNVVGINITPQAAVTVRDFQSTNSVRALVSSDPTDSVTLVDATLTGGSSGTTAVSNSNSANMFMRNVTSSGYAALVSNNGQQVSGTTIAEWTSKAPISLFSGSATTSLNLPIQETPLYNDTGFANWANVKTYGAVANNPGVDSAAAIQAAIDSGKTTVYLPAGIYYMSKTIHLRGNVVRVLGVGAAVAPFQNGGFGSAPTFEIDNTNSGLAILERVMIVANENFAQQQFFNNGNWSGSVLNASTGTVVIKNMDAFSYTNSVAGGTVYMEDVSWTGPFTFTNQTAYIRHMDVEPSAEVNPTHVTVSGGQVWILGLKTENSGTILSISGDAKVEVLGEAVGVYNGSAVESSDPMILVSNSRVSVAGVMTLGDPGYDYNTWVQETRRGTTNYLYCGSTANGCPGSTPKAYERTSWSSELPLYIGF